MEKEDKGGIGRWRKRRRWCKMIEEEEKGGAGIKRKRIKVVWGER